MRNLEKDLSPKAAVGDVVEHDRISKGIAYCDIGI